MRRLLFVLSIMLFAIAFTALVFMLVMVDEINYFSAVFHIEAVMLAATAAVAILLAIIGLLCLALSSMLGRLEKLEKGDEE